jgi:ATP-binding cassette subfamily B protein
MTGPSDSAPKPHAVPSDVSLRGAVARVGRALRLVWRADPRRAGVTALIVAVQGGLPLVALWLMKQLVDELSRGLPGAAAPVDLGRVMTLVVMAGLVALTGGLVRAIGALVGEAQAQAVTDHVHDVLHAKSIEVDLEYYEDARYYDTLHRAQAEASFRPARIQTEVVEVARSGVALLAMAGLLVSFHWAVALVLFLAAAPGVLVRARYSGRMYQWQHRRTPTERRAGYFHWMLTGTIHAKEIRLFDLGPLFRQRYREIRDRLRQERLAIARSRFRADAVTQVTTTVAVFGSYAFIAWRTATGTITLGDFVMYYQAFQRGQEFLKEMLGGLAGLWEDQLFLSSFYEFLDLERRTVEPAAPRALPQPFRSVIAFDRVSFRYPGAAREALADISLSIRPGEHIAFVGENGSGKTTLVKLLCRLYDPSAGRIALDGADLREFETTAWRRQISVLFQDYVLYHLTARENVWFGDTRVPPDSPAIVEAARRSGADEVIRGLREGYDTRLGKWLEEGEELSVGQWQKIALARAFLRTAPIVVLDEPTSSLDAQAEYEVFNRFRDLVQGRTSIIISHRFSTVRMADRIYVFEKGRIIEEGNHAALMQRGGTYARMFEIQAQHYR